MKIEIHTNLPEPKSPYERVGEVYPVKAGDGSNSSLLYLILACYKTAVGLRELYGYAVLTVTREGVIAGSSSFSENFFDNREPIAKIQGIDNLILKIRSLKDALS